MRCSTSLIALFVTCTTGLFAVASQDDSSSYAVVSLVGESDPYFEAVRKLARIRDGRILQSDSADFRSLLEEFRDDCPKYVAVVLRPESLDENLAHRFLVFATQVDDDPFVDFAYGFITGDSPATAVQLAGAAKRAEQRRRKPDLAMLGVAGAELAQSISSSQELPLRRGTLSQSVHMIAAGDAANSTSPDVDPNQDDAFIRQAMPHLAGHSMILFAGHGYPQRVVGGPTYKHLVGQQFEGAVVMNIACYTGVTTRWFDNDWKSMTVREKEVSAENSFCLNMLKTGVAGYVAYLSARPAGPAMLGDAITLATAGESIGELMRQNANTVVMAHLQQGDDQLKVVDLKDGTPIDRNRTTQDVLAAMSTGGVLFGDPAFVPFARQPNAHPHQVKIKRNGDAIAADVEFVGPLYHFFCSDQIAMWDERTQSLKLEAVVPIGERFLTDVRLVRSSLNDAPHRLTAAMENHEGRRFVHVKASFAQPPMETMVRLAGKGFSGTFEIITSESQREGSIVRHSEAL